MTRRALVLVDLQNDFCEGGSLAVAGGAAVAEAVSAYTSAHALDYATIVATADWHVDPGAHWSDTPDYVDSWPVHCAVGTPGSAFHPAADAAIAHAEAIFRKGLHRAAYSGFQGSASEGAQATGLAEWLRHKEIDEIDVVGIATDHCVRATALDAAGEGFRTRVLLELTAGVARPTTDAALAEMTAAGIELVGRPVLGA